MDPFSLLAGSAGIAALCVKISAALYTFIDDAKSVDRNVRDLLDEIKALSRVAEAIGQSWTRNALVDAAQIESGGDLWGSVQDTLADCKSSLKKLDEALKGVEKRGFLPRNILRTIRLNLKMKDILLFKQQFHTYNSAMQSALQMINTCLLISSSSSQDSIQRVLLSLKVQIERIEGNVNERPTLPLSLQESAERDRVVRNLSRLARMANDFHTSASTIIEGDRSTVWGGSVLGDPLTQEQHGRINDWIPAVLEEDDGPQYAPPPFSSAQGALSQYAPQSSPYYSGDLDPLGTRPSHSPVPPLSDSSNGDAEVEKKLLVMEELMKKAQKELTDRDAKEETAAKAEIEIVRKAAEEKAAWEKKLDEEKKAAIAAGVRAAKEAELAAALERQRVAEEKAAWERKLEEEKKAWEASFRTANDAKIAAAQRTVSEEANRSITELQPGSDSESGSDVERDLMNRFMTLGASEYQKGNRDKAEMYLRKAVMRETKRQSQAISHTKAMLICCCMLKDKWDEAESLLLPLVMSKKLNNDPLVYFCLYGLSVLKGAEGDWNTSLRYCQQAVWGIRKMKVHATMPYQVSLRFLSHIHGVLGNKEEEEGFLSFVELKHWANNELDPQIALTNVLAFDYPTNNALPFVEKVEPTIAKAMESAKETLKETVVPPKVVENLPRKFSRFIAPAPETLKETLVLPKVVENFPRKSTRIIAPAPALVPVTKIRSGPTAKASWSYEAIEVNELSFDEDATITDVEFPDDEWWYGHCNGRSGLFPANYVQLD